MTSGRSGGGRSGGDKSDGDKSDGDKSDGGKSDGDKRDGGKSNGDKSDGDKNDGGETGGEGASGSGTGKPPGTAWPEDPLLHPASDAGWNDEPAGSKRTTKIPAPPNTATAALAPPVDAPTAPVPSLTTTTTAAPPAQTAIASVPPPTGAAVPVARNDATTDAARPWRSPSFPAYAPPAGAADAAQPRPAETTAPRPTDAAPTRSADAAPSRPAAPVRSAATPASATSAGQTPAGDEPLLPASYHENDLRSAVGASPLSEPTTAAKPRKRPAPAPDPRHDTDDDDDAPGRPRNRKAIVVAAFSITAGLAIAGLVFLGRANSDRYVLACEAERAVPQAGRAFPPWGTHGLEGEQWRPLKIAPETRCQPHETDDPLVLERLYLAMVLDQATALLTAREVTKLDEAEALLKQALLLTRPAESEPVKLAAERTEHHSDIERLLGDVTYWRASAKLHDAATALADAAKQFDSAATQHPRHVTDAAAWAGYARKLAEELHAGPAGATQALAPPAPMAPASATAAAAHPSAPPGIALPIEPDKGSAEQPPAATTPPPDASVPTGGVLL